MNVPHGTSAKEVRCHLGSRDIELQVRGQEIFKGKLYDTTVSDEATWTRGQVSHPDYSDEDEKRGGELLVLPAGGGVLCQRLGPGPDAEKAHIGEVSA